MNVFMSMYELGEIDRIHRVRVSVRHMPKSRTSFNLPDELVQEARDAVAYLGGPPLYLTLAQLAEEGIRLRLEQLKREHNRGKPFPRFTGRIKIGRPMGS